jgi:hypothetical protein
MQHHPFCLTFICLNTGTVLNCIGQAMLFIWLHMEQHAYADISVRGMVIWCWLVPLLT